MNSADLSAAVNHMHMIAIDTVFYNWTKLHKTLRTTPAMAAGLTDRIWDMVELVRLMDEVSDHPSE